MKNLGGVIGFVISLCLFSIAGFSQETVNGKSTQDQSDNYLLLVKNSELKFNQGEGVKIELVLKNNSNEEIYFIWSSDLDDFSIEVKDESQKSMSLRKEAELAKQVPKSGSTTAIRLGQTHHFLRILSK